MEHSRTSVINYLIEQNKYKNYLEIGIRYPHQNYDKIICESKTGIDPAVDYPTVIKKTSEEFFDSNEKKFDLIFIDGDHKYAGGKLDALESLLCLNDGGTIVMHDCYPKCKEYQGDERLVDTWHGSIWKVFVELRANPLLTCYCCEVDCGCGIVRPIPSKPIDIGSELTWELYENNKEYLLGLVSFDNFLKMERKL